MSEPHEIIIVRRKHGDHDGHHGGVWKIAFADFMTAMMAFFLVLWIVNSTSKETRSSIARYFNPIKLSDTTPARKGLQDPRDTDFDASAPNKPDGPKPATKQSGPGGGAPTVGKVTEESSASRTVERADRDAIGGRQNEGGAGPAPADKYQDPFELLRPKVDRHGYGEDRGQQPVEQAQQQPQTPSQAQAQATSPDAPAAQPSSPSSQERAAQAGASTDKPADKQGDKPATAAAQAPNNDAQLQAPGAGSIGAAVQAILKQERDMLADSNIQVREVAEGTLISLLDNNRNAMFQSGSSTLSPDASASLGRIAKAISKLPNGVIVSGYTDSSPYRGGQNNNWRLSAMRAEAALNILLASGVGQQRIERIEGHADRSPHDTAGKAPQNRRIDILLRKTNG